MLRLRELRESNHMNMTQVAKAIGIPYTTYISYEKGDREPNSEMLITLASYFDCSIDYLVGKTGQMIDGAAWDPSAKAYKSSQNSDLKSDYKLVRQLFPDVSQEDSRTLVQEIIPLIRMMNHVGIQKLAERADELCRLREYMRQG